MAKVNIDAALEALREQGFELTEEQEQKLAEFKTNTLRDSASEYIGRKLSNNNKTARNNWTTKAFTLAEELAADFEAKKVGRGRGEVLERMFRVETPNGWLKVSLSESAEDTEESE